jgi:rubredoxin
VATDFLLSNATGGIKLMVREPDVAAAVAVLRSKGTAELAIESGDVAGDDEDGYCDEDWRCPKCHRTDVELVPLRRRLAMLSILLLGVPLLLARRTLRCRNCGHEWRQ